jgi:hypothetical protein
LELAQGEEVSDDEGDLADPLFKVEIVTIESTMEGAEEGKDAGGIKKEAHPIENNCWDE